MTKKSATMLGNILGVSARDVNKALIKGGFLTGKPGRYQLTEKGKLFGEIRRKTNGFGGYCKREWSFPMWGEAIIDKIKDFL